MLRTCRELQAQAHFGPALRIHFGELHVGADTVVVHERLGCPLYVSCSEDGCNSAMQNYVAEQLLEDWRPRALFTEHFMLPVLSSIKQC